MGILRFGFAAIVAFGLASCDSGTAPAGDNGPATDVLASDPGNPGDPDPGTDLPAPRDLSGDDTAVPGDPGVPDPGVVDLGLTDPGPLDPGTPDAGTDAGFDPDAPAYGQCAVDGDCPEGLVCDVPYADAKYGFCSRQCNNDAECPASTLAIPQGCHKEPEALLGWCTSLCGVNNGGSTTCEDWLQCVASQWCLPPSSTIPTKGPGEACTGGAECLSGDCVEGQSTRAHCALKCTSDAECAGPDGAWKGTCITAGGLPYNFCLWTCGMMGGGAVCPGQLQCVGMSVCQ